MIIGAAIAAPAAAEPCKNRRREIRVGFFAMTSSPRGGPVGPDERALGALKRSASLPRYRGE
jgi:hypothetical protein